MLKQLLLWREVLREKEIDTKKKAVDSCSNHPSSCYFPHFKNSSIISPAHERKEGKKKPC